jgi:uncharacterized membrane protein
MISLRTKVLIWSTALPVMAVMAVTVFLRMRLYYYQSVAAGRYSEFIAFHFRLLPLGALLSVWGILFVGALTSFFADQRDARKSKECQK